MKYGMLFFAAALTVLFSGCISYKYEGNVGGAPKESVQVYGSADAIRKPYTVLGKATVSGKSENVNRDQLVDKLVKEAGKQGADAILIVEQQVVPASESSSAANERLIYDNDTVDSSYREISRDMDMTYGNIRHRSEMESHITSYRRIIRAEYLLFKAGEVKADPGKKDASAADVKAEKKEAAPAAKPAPVKKDAPAADTKAEKKAAAPAAKPAPVKKDAPAAEARAEKKEAASAAK